MLIEIRVNKLDLRYRPNIFYLDENEFNRLIEFLKASEKPFILMKISDNEYYLHFLKARFRVERREQGYKHKSR